MIDVNLTIRMDAVSLPLGFAETLLADLRRITEGVIQAINVEDCYPLESEMEEKEAA